MFITRTPFRLSLFGGGTDYPIWFNKHRSLVISSAFEKYCYIFVRALPRFFPYRYRLVYSNIELIEKEDEIKHPSIRNVIKFFGNPKDLEISHTGDLPARSGIGSSSTFTVGLLNAIGLHLNQIRNDSELATSAIHIEQNLIGEPVGVQDQIMASYGGIKAIHLGPGDNMKIVPVNLSDSYKKNFEESVLLGFSGFSRISSLMAQKQIDRMTDPNMVNLLEQISEISFDALRLLSEEHDIEKLGKLLHETWHIKKNFVSGISIPEVDQIYEVGISNGAFGGKLMGAGGGGFFYFIAPKDKHKKIKEALPQVKVWVPYKIANEGSQMIYDSSSVVRSIFRI